MLYRSTCLCVFLFAGYGLQGGTRINLGFGRCLKLRVKAERDEGSLRIGGLALAANCHHIVLIFGFFFLLAGAVLTTLAYKTKSAVQEAESLDVSHQVMVSFETRKYHSSRAFFSRLLLLSCFLCSFLSFCLPISLSMQP